MDNYFFFLAFVLFLSLLAGLALDYFVNINIFLLIYDYWRGAGTIIYDLIRN